MKLSDSLVAKANHLFWAFFAIAGSSDCSDAETEPQGYSAPTPIPKRNLEMMYKLGHIEYGGNAPHSAEHAQQTTHPSVRSNRTGGQKREKSNDGGCTHLNYMC
jgi:hypothetical protein